VELVRRMERFRIPETVGGSSATWDDALRWWFRLPEVSRVPTITQVARWHDYLQQQLRYRFTWGLGAALAVAADESDPQGLFDAEASGLPWAAIWVKDLLTWGTSDPAAAYLLARGAVDTRDAPVLHHRSSPDGCDHAVRSGAAREEGGYRTAAS
jgi:hypothetical protein